MTSKIILASKSQVRKKILEKNGFYCEVDPANIDEENIKESLLKEGLTPLLISKNLAELKANKISNKKNGKIVIGADSVIDLEGQIISKPSNKETIIHTSRLKIDAENNVIAILIGPNQAPRTIPICMSPKPIPCRFVIIHINNIMAQGITAPTNMPHNEAERYITLYNRPIIMATIPINMNTKGT